MATAATATATTTPTPPPQPPPPGGESLLPLHFLKSIDMSTLSQSQLQTLSSLSSLSIPLNPTTASLPPTAHIDRSSFNESSGSRRQTYSRLSPHTHHRHHRLAGPLPKSLNPPNQNPLPNFPPFPLSEPDPDRVDIRSILSSLKKLLSSHPDFNFAESIEFSGLGQFYDCGLGPVGAVVDNGERKRKRGRKPRAVGPASGEGNVGLVNRRGMVVDLVDLAKKEDPFAGELARRTAGMDKEEELLGFFAALGGEWCSRRKRRKVVDAEEFGDDLPLGWKLLLGLRRKEGRAWVYCRRYVSPDGQHFISCEQVSAYLQSFIGSYNVWPGKDHASYSIQQVHFESSENHVDTKDDKENQELSNQREKDITLLAIDNLEEVEVRDLFECPKCNISYDEKDSYLQHLLSVHQQSTRRYRAGSSVGEGVIIKDGKYECQFCHKVFLERRRYSGHVGIHVRNFVRGIEDAPGVRMALEKRNGSAITDDSPARISKMDALIEIAQNSIRETSPSEPNKEFYVGSTSDKQNISSQPENLQALSDTELNSDSPQAEMEDDASDRSTDTEIHVENFDYMDIDGHKIDDICNIVDVKVDSSLVYMENGQTLHDTGNGQPHALLNNQDTSISENSNQHIQGNCDEVKTGINVQVGFDVSNRVPDNYIGHMSPRQHFDENVLKCDNLDAPTISMHPAQEFSMLNAIMDKGGDVLRTDHHGPVKITGFEELRMEEIEQLKFSYGTGQDAMSPGQIPTVLGSSAEIEGACGSTVQFASDGIVDSGDSQQHTTLCVWCGDEFIHETVDTELQSDSVGYMCPTCKAKISGQLNVLDGGCS